MRTIEAIREGLDTLLEAVPAMTLERRQLEQSLRDADKRMEALRAECAAAIEHQAALQLAQAAEDRNARDKQVLQIERDRIVGLISLQLQLLNQRSINARALKALRRMILEDTSTSELARRGSPSPTIPQPETMDHTIDRQEAIEVAAHNAIAAPNREIEAAARENRSADLRLCMALALEAIHEEMTVDQPGSGRTFDLPDVIAHLRASAAPQRGEQS